MILLSFCESRDIYSVETKDILIIIIGETLILVLEYKELEEQKKKTYCTFFSSAKEVLIVVFIPFFDSKIFQAECNKSD